MHAWWWHGQAIIIYHNNRPTKDAFPSADSVFRVHSPNAKSSRAEIYSKDWFIFDTSLILPEYIVYFKYLSPVMFNTYECAIVLILYIP